MAPLPQPSSSPATIQSPSSQTIIPEITQPNSTASQTIDTISMIAQVIGALTSLLALALYLYYRPYRRSNNPRPVINVYLRKRRLKRKYARPRTPDRRSSSRELQAAGRCKSEETLVHDGETRWEGRRGAILISFLSVFPFSSLFSGWSFKGRWRFRKEGQ